MPSPGRTALAIATFLAAATLAVGTAVVAVAAIERRSSQGVRSALALDGQDWVEVSADGLLLQLSGLAETEALRFRAVSIAGRVIDQARVIDAIEVRPAAELRAPDFSVEILRNDDGISLIGLIPAALGREGLADDIADLADDTGVSDMLETADYPVPETWEAALGFGLEALRRLPRSKISVTPDRVTVTAITGSADEKARLEAELARLVPEGVALAMELSAPRPVITPFTLRFLIDEGGARFDACSADTEAARARILAAAVAAGAQGKIDCTLGLGVPSPSWAEAVADGVSAMAELGAGSLTFSDADVSLVAADSVAQADFDRVVGELQRALPDLFSLTAVLTPKAETDATDGPAEFTATLSAESGLQLRGPLPDGTVRTVVESFAVARFGADRVYNATRLDASLPGGWSVRVLAALQALAELSNGSVVVQPDRVAIRGQTGSAGASAEIARLFAAELGEGAKFDIAVTYVERLDPTADLPTPEECVREINIILATEKIVFAPGSAEIPGEAISTLDAIATALKNCAEVPIEIGAHSDSQGRDEMNLRLSQERADAVLNGLMARRVLTSNIRAVGYGETQPIADNGTEEGREANRRIEFTLIAQEVDGTASTEDSAAGGEGTAGEDAATEDTDAEGTEEGAAEGATEDGNAQTGGAEGTE